MKSLFELQILLTSIAILLSPVNSQGVASITGLNPGDIPLATRQSWCQSQKKTCGQLCTGSGQQVGQDTCDYVSHMQLVSGIEMLLIPDTERTVIALRVRR